MSFYKLGQVQFDSKKSFPPLTPFNNEWTSFNRMSFDSVRTTIVSTYEETFPNYEKFYREEKPDLMICDFGSNSCIDSASKHSIPLAIGHQSLLFWESPSYFTKLGRIEPSTIDQLSLFKRIKHIIWDQRVKEQGYLPYLRELNEARKKWGVPESQYFLANSNLGLGLVNSFVGFDSPRKLATHINFIGPVLSDKVQSMSAELEEFLNTREKVLYVGFGSHVFLNSGIQQKLLELFQKLYNEGKIDGLIWGGLHKTNFDEFPKTYTVNDIEYSTESLVSGEHKNFKLMGWAPQEPVLNHKSTKLFLSHGGLDSVYESLSAGKPLLILPFFADQPRNGVLIEERGIGKVINWYESSQQEIYMQFEELLNPGNVQLQTKLKQIKQLTDFNSKNKFRVPDVIENYIKSAKICRLTSPPKGFEVPCELELLLPIEYTKPEWLLNSWDIYMLLAVSSLVVGFGVLSKFIRVWYWHCNKVKLD
ncbi:glycosyltransferase family 1 protein [Conidiobolus coronatus NRRL 28638]|uniref:Glycosyltransferase family 1 protein n=1 Tax=Conidiobolus coronatus (strain ATCC 28846 / CBS 209.66 / NRRL 28638) TaxID=796925 RepID=A0A137NWD5_CONC2|nr:glycosyltransferase family 1 protein [Conidiobolus coronatus NRRL 28638]|eukprot:KXN66939.1 glycosyltransferase family 1 protein [Conidiobolus coronatus NRRL 28638]